MRRGEVIKYFVIFVIVAALAITGGLPIVRELFGWVVLAVIMGIILIPVVIPSKYFQPVKKGRK